MTAFSCPSQSEELVISGQWRPCSRMRATSTTLKRRQWTDDAESVAVLQRQLNIVDKAVRSITIMQTIWQSSRSSIHTTPFYTLVPYTHHCHCSVPRTNRNVMASQTYSPFELIHLLILRPSTSTRHVCISFHVSIFFGNSTLSEECITVTLLVTQDTSLLET